VRVLELARFQAGPRGGMILSDLGAEVIKIEPPYASTFATRAGRTCSPRSSRSRTSCSRTFVRA
jgi:crotonobetainyl-CoA:carnitine CoA-transferase CaiB-like acyl-CoA transferase